MGVERNTIYGHSLRLISIIHVKFISIVSLNRDLSSIFYVLNYTRTFR